VTDDPRGYPGAPPDWYPDPAGGPGRRWWDGYAWSEAVVLPDQPPSPESTPSGYGMPGHEMHGYGTAGYGTPWYSNAPVANATALCQEELRISQMAKGAVIIIGLYFLWGYINLRIQGSLYRSIGHQYHRMIIAAQNHQTAPQFTLSDHTSGATVAIGGLLGLAALAGVIIACVWQYRAASTARALGYPAKHSPGWGVGSWFVPIVALWMPYQALRDCLAPDDPNRQLVKRFWLFFIGQGLFATAAVTSAFFTTSLSLVFGIPGALLCLGMVSTAPRFVTAIGSAHQAAVGAGSLG
jgi:hypothetical protein